MNISIHYNNIFSRYIGTKNGITKKDFNSQKKNVLKAIDSLKDKRKSGELGFFDLPYEKKPLQNFKLPNKSFKNVLVIGIGGSILGGLALNRALTNLYGNYNGANKKFFFLDNIDPDQITDLKKSLDLKKTLIILISKSGKTPEMVASFLHLKKLIPTPLKNNVVIITEENKNFLNKFAKDNDIQTLKVPSNVGGRFSVLSPVGLLPAYLTGIKINKILKGAKKADKNWQNKNIEKNIAAILAISAYLLNKKKFKHNIVLMPYSAKLGRVADWYIQLLAESIGKKENIGLTPIKAIGTTDQHSQLQLFTEGPNDKTIIFIENKQFKNKLKIPKDKKEYKDIDFLYNRTVNELIKAEKKGTEMALAKAGRPNLTLELPYLDEETFGELIFTLQVQVALLGELYKIDAFNQPGVELSKTLTKKYLKDFST